MRKLLAITLAVMTAALGLPLVSSAQSATAARQAGMISGMAIDAAGQALPNQRVELLRNTEVVNATVTGSRGDWMFTNVAPGEYVVRTVVNDKIAGIHLFVEAGQPITNALIVTPSAAAASPAFLAALGLLWGTVATAGIVAGAGLGVLAASGHLVHSSTSP